MNAILALFFAMSLLSYGALPKASADSGHMVLRRIAVFPVDAPGSYASGAERAWWKVREELTGNRRFLIASKQFLVRKEVFQPRRELEPADAVILGKILDANALITTYFKDKQLHMVAYSGANGMTLWRNTVTLHPSIPIDEQLEPAALKLIRDFSASIPYQGFQIIDPLIGKAVYEVGQAVYAKGEIGTDTQAQKGDVVQWVRITGMDPLFQEGGQMTVIAEGQITQIEADIITIEIKRVSDVSLLVDKSLLRLPKEAQRLQESFAFKDRFRKQVGPEMLSAELSPTEPQSNAARPLLTALSAIGTVALLILLAF